MTMYAGQHHRRKRWRCLPPPLRLPGHRARSISPRANERQRRPPGSRIFRDWRGHRAEARSRLTAAQCRDDGTTPSARAVALSWANRLASFAYELDGARKLPEEGLALKLARQAGRASNRPAAGQVASERSVRRATARLSVSRCPAASRATGAPSPCLLAGRGSQRAGPGLVPVSVWHDCQTCVTTRCNRRVTPVHQYGDRMLVNVLGDGAWRIGLWWFASPPSRQPRRAGQQRRDHPWAKEGCHARSAAAGGRDKLNTIAKLPAV